MSLEKYQDVLSKLTTNYIVRKSFFEDRNKYVDALYVSDSYKNKLLALDEKQIMEFSMGLLRKRFGTVKKLLILDEKEVALIQPIYFSYAKVTPIKGKVFKHQFDALNFLKHLKSEKIKFDEDLKIKLKHRQMALENYLVSENQIKSKRRLKIPRFLKFK